MCRLRDRLTLGRRPLPRNPGPFGGGDSHPSLLLLPPGSAPPVGPLDLSAQLLPNRSAPLPADPRRGLPPGLGSWLSPENLRGPGSRLVSCYALFKGWLLLSLPPSCLRSGTPFGLTLSQHLGALTRVWVVPLSAHRLFPWNPSPPIYGAGRFGVQKRGWAFRPTHPQLVALPRQQPPGGLGCDPLRGEPAITELDWSFAPRPGSEERIARQNPCGPPPGFRLASPCPGLDRSVSGYHRSDYSGPRRTPPLSTLSG